MALFDYFVIFAEMRTGSNFLEQNLNQIEGLTSYGEAFNPGFLGFPKTTEILGVDQAQRDNDPRDLLRAIKKDPGGLGGFRYFHDHDPRIFDKIMDDPRCAKIILTRNPADSYVSWKIATSTGQWKLTDVKARKSAKAQFDKVEFDEHIETLQTFQVTLLNRLQCSGQSAFYVAYEDLQNIDVINGMAQYLGVDGRLDGLDKTLKVQNPSALADKVENFEDMQQSLTGLDRFNLTRTPNFEPRPGPAVPTWVTGTKTPLLYMPIRGRLDHDVRRWLARLDNGKPADLGGKHGQGDLRSWLKDNPGHRSFTILRHPVARAHDVFCQKILPSEGGFPGIRATLRRRYKLPLPEEFPSDGFSVEEHRAAFLSFLTFLKANLAEQTAVRVDALWASQAKILQGFAEFTIPDRLIRESDLPEALNDIAKEVGHPAPETFSASDGPAPFALSEIYNAQIEKAARDAYARDYMMFGFLDWA
jgi:LPS sulfotransferase NodH